MVRSKELRSSSINDPTSFIKDVSLPPPPVYPRGKLSVPTYLDYTDPRTRWMLNLLRTGTDYRLSLMLHQKPECFQYYYQIPDCPAAVCNDKSDNNCMFHQSTILYFNALCLSIYMKKIKAVETMLKSGLISPSGLSYACDVYTRGSRIGSDILEILPICICIRREVFSAIPLLAHIDTLKIKSATISPFTPRDKIELRYINKDIQKKFFFIDCLNYATETLKKSGSFPLARMLDILLLETPEYFPSDRFEIIKDKTISIFQRFAQLAYIEDKDCRMSLQIFQSLENLLKYKCVPWKPGGVDNIQQFLQLTQSRNLYLIDQYSCISILLALYERLLNRPKGGLLSYLGDLVYKTINYMNWTQQFLQIPNKQLSEMFKATPQSINISEETLLLIKRHIVAIIRLERDRDLRTLDGRPKRNPITSYWKTNEETGNSATRKQALDNNKVEDEQTNLIGPSHIAPMVNTEVNERLPFGDYESSSPSPTESLNKFMNRDGDNEADSLASRNQEDMPYDTEKLLEVFRVEPQGIRPFEANYRSNYAAQNNHSFVPIIKSRAHPTHPALLSHHNNSCNNQLYNYPFGSQPYTFRRQYSSQQPCTGYYGSPFQIPSSRKSWHSMNSNPISTESGMSPSDLEIQEYENSVLNELYYEYGEETANNSLYTNKIFGSVKSS